MIATGNHNFEKFAALCNTLSGEPRRLRRSGRQVGDPYRAYAFIRVLPKIRDYGRILSAPTGAVETMRPYWSTSFKTSFFKRFALLQTIWEAGFIYRTARLQKRQ